MATRSKRKTVDNRKKIPGGVLAEGEITFHAHRVDVDVFEGENRTREFSGAATLTHEEHGPIVLPAREWASDTVQEYDYLSKMVRKVVD